MRLRARVRSYVRSVVEEAGEGFSPLSLDDLIFWGQAAVGVTYGTPPIITSYESQSPDSESYSAMLSPRTSSDPADAGQPDVFDTTPGAGSLDHAEDELYSPNVTKRSWAGWFRRNNIVDTHMPWSHGDGISQRAWQLRFRNTNAVGVEFLHQMWDSGDVEGITTVALGGSFNGTWRHFACTWDGGAVAGSRLKVYLDASPITGFTDNSRATVDNPSSGTFSIFSGLGGTFYYRGHCDDIIVTAGVMTADQVSQLFAYRARSG